MRFLEIELSLGLLSFGFFLLFFLFFFLFFFLLRFLLLFFLLFLWFWIYSFWFALLWFHEAEARAAWTLEQELHFSLSLTYHLLSTLQSHTHIPYLKTKALMKVEHWLGLFLLLVTVLFWHFSNNSVFFSHLIMILLSLVPLQPILYIFNHVSKAQLEW